MNAYHNFIQYIDIKTYWPIMVIDSNIAISLDKNLICYEKQAVFIKMKHGFFEKHAVLESWSSKTYVLIGKTTTSVPKR